MTENQRRREYCAVCARYEQCLVHWGKMCNRNGGRRVPRFDGSGDVVRAVSKELAEKLKDGGATLEPIPKGRSHLWEHGFPEKEQSLCLWMKKHKKHLIALVWHKYYVKFGRASIFTPMIILRKLRKGIASRINAELMLGEIDYKGKAAIAGLGITQMGKVNISTTTDFAVEAISLSLKDSGLKKDDRSAN